MHISGEIEAEIQRYLKGVAVHLEGMSAAEKQEILEDLRSHIHDALAARAGEAPRLEDVQAVLEQMDPPQSYRTVRSPSTYGAIGSSGGGRTPLGPWALGVALVALVVPGALAALSAAFHDPAKGGILFAAAALGIVLGAVALALGLRSRSDPAGKAGAWIGGITAGAALLFAAWVLLWCVPAPGPTKSAEAPAMAEVAGAPDSANIPSPYVVGRTYRLVRTARVTMIDAGQPAGSTGYSLACTVKASDDAQEGPTRLSVQYAGRSAEAGEPGSDLGAGFRKPQSFTVPLPHRAAPVAGGNAGASQPAPAEQPAGAARAVLQEAALAPVRFLPRGPVKAGATWDAPLEEIATAFRGGLRLRPSRRSVSCKLVEVRKGRDGSTAVISLHRSTVVEAAAMGDGPWRAFPPSQGTMTCELSGELHYEPDTGRLLAHRMTLRSIEPDSGGVEIRWDTELTVIENNSSEPD